MSAWDHAKISENSCNSDKKGLIFSCKREFPKLTCFGLSWPNNGCNNRGSAILESSYSTRWALSCHCYLVGMSSLCYLTL